MWLLGKLGDTRVSPKPAIAPPSGRSTWSSTKLGWAGVSKAALAQLMPKTTGCCAPFVKNGTWPLCSVGSAKPSGQPWSRCRITNRPSL